MKIRQIQLSPYDFTYAHGYRRLGALIKVENEDGNHGEGDLAPLPERSSESLFQAIAQLEEYKALLSSIEWDRAAFLEQLAGLSLLPSLAFALESVLFSLFTPLFSCSLEVAALLMGNSLRQILDIAEARKKEGFTIAKLKISNLSREDASTAIHELKGMFTLRIDVNSRWALSDSIRFFSQFPIEIFDYIEDPTKSLKELGQFPYPIAVEAAISKGVSLSLLETIPTLKAITYKPTVQGGYLVGKQFKRWADERGISLVLSSSLESDVGHFHLAVVAGRLGLTAPIGIGTYQYLNQHLAERKLNFTKGRVII